MPNSKKCQLNGKQPKFFLLVSFCILVLLKHKSYRKNCRLQRDSNSDRRNWPLDHHHGPINTSLSNYWVEPADHLLPLTISVAYVSSWIRFVSTRTLDTAGVEPEVAEAADSLSPFPVSPFSFVLDSDLCDPDDDEGRSLSSGFGCIRVNGSSATSSLKWGNAFS